MSGQIRSGDVVMIVKPTLCCGQSTVVGMMFLVGEVGEWPGSCCHCACELEGVVRATGLGSHAIEISRLVRVDPKGVRKNMASVEESTG